jgi:hypothetical protein
MRTLFEVAQVSENIDVPETVPSVCHKVTQLGFEVSPSRKYTVGPFTSQDSGMFVITVLLEKVVSSTGNDPGVKLRENNEVTGVVTKNKSYKKEI